MWRIKIYIIDWFISETNAVEIINVPDIINSENFVGLYRLFACISQQCSLLCYSVDALHRTLTYLVHRQNTWRHCMGCHSMRKNVHSRDTCRTLGIYSSSALPSTSWCSSSATLYHCTCQLMSLSRRTTNYESDLCVVQPSTSSIPKRCFCGIQLLPVLSLKIFHISTDNVITVVTVLSNRRKLLTIEPLKVIMIQATNILPDIYFYILFSFYFYTLGSMDPKG